MSSTTFVALCLVSVVCLAKAEDFEDFKRNQTNVAATKSLRKKYEGIAKDVDDCLKNGEDLKADAVQFHTTLKTCEVFKGKPQGGDFAENADYILFTRTESESDDSLSAGAIVATIVLCIVYGLCLIALALFFWNEEKADISKQMDVLEEKELGEEVAKSDPPVVEDK